MKQTKSDYKRGISSRAEIKAAKGERKAAKRELDKSYKALKYDHLADQGKDLYKSGKTITGITQKHMKTQTAIILGGYVAKEVLSQVASADVASLAGNTIVVGGSAVNGIIAAKGYHEVKRLRAYYAH